MSRLEERYRLLLRLLPAAYRQEWEDDMVAAFLESMDTGDPETTAYLADYGRPSLSEAASIVALAVRLRLRADTSPRSRVWGHAVQLATLMLLLTHAVMVTGSIAIALWYSGKLAWLPAPAPEFALTTPASIWSTTWNLAGYAWLPAYLALVLGYRRVAQAVALLAIVPPIITTAMAQAVGDEPLTVSPWAMRLVDVALLLAMAAFPHGAAPVSRRPWLLALPIGIFLVALPLFILQAVEPALRLLDWPGLLCAAVAVAMAVHLTARATGRSTRTLPWSLAFTLLAATALVLRAVTLPDFLDQAERTTLTTIAAVQVVAVLTVGVPLAVSALRALRNVPSAPAATPNPTTPS
ncbi:hypothetical protein GCM10009541_05200 [Micromonospora gifhornensis]|uniref:Uncharacterized protein n=1 Tax=Micromonospora gifhornensis TaxID=84594 RepID=A0ABQ4IDC7_9ACTN|nr:hypothetical protein [Micromonospora gifhornensis]GIJ15816.1 hypothetical protein Vgi01_25000 [Micromonospora gifhornensis]